MTCPPGADAAPPPSSPKSAALGRPQEGDAANPQARMNPGTAFWASSWQLRGFPWINLISSGHRCSLPHRASPLVVTQPAAPGQRAKPRRVWQRDVQCAGQRLLLSLAGCFPEFLLQGNVFMLWNSCSLKIRAEQEHKSSVCSSGAATCHRANGRYELCSPELHATNSTALAERSEVLQHTNYNVLFFTPLRKNNPPPHRFQMPLVTLRAPDLELCWGSPAQLSPFTPEACEVMHLQDPVRYHPQIAVRTLKNIVNDYMGQTARQTTKDLEKCSDKVYL